jgi:hypothetical protein
LQANVESGLPCGSTQIGDWSTPTKWIVGLAFAAATVSPVMLKPTVTIRSNFWSTNCWMSALYSEASFGTIEGGVAALSVVAASTAPL